VGLKAVNCRSGDVLANEQATASGKEQVLKALGEAATQMREKLGESLASVQNYDAPAENVTTPSLEALQAYSLGYQAMERTITLPPFLCSSGPPAWTPTLPWHTRGWEPATATRVKPPVPPRILARATSCVKG